MAEYINKTKFEELMRKKSRTYFDLCYIDKIREHYNKAIGYSLAADEAHDFPVEDVQPVRHGRWIEKPPYKDETVKGLEFQIVCSECDEQNCSLEFDENYNAIGKTFYRTRYCPNCGARMDGETNG